MIILRFNGELFKTFCIYFGLQFLPACLDTVCIYAQFLSRSFKSVESIKNYINGIRLMHLINGFEFSYLQSLPLRLTLRGIATKKSHLPKRALPVTPEILYDMFKILDKGNPSDVTFWCLFLIAFFMFSRKSNLVPISISKFDSNKQFCRKDFSVKGHYLVISVRWSKTIQFGQRVLEIPLAAIPHSNLCPVKAFTQMCKSVPAGSNDPVFCKYLGSRLVPITYHEFQSKFRELIFHTGRDPSLYSTHSFRRGGASFAFESNVSSELLQLHGDWRSDVYKKYLEFTLNQKLLVTEKMRDRILSLSNI